jgi:hypothetical protein
MPSIRIGFATGINLVNEQVGIGTTNPTARLDVRGQIRANNSAGGGGITTFTTYDGFLHSQQNLTNNISIASTTRGNLNSLSGEIKITGEVTVSDGTPITGGRLDSLTVTGSFDLPSSGSVGRELKPEKGSTRFNQDLGQLEFYTGLEWRTTASYDGSGRGRGVFGGGIPSTQYQYINISTLGNSSYFGTSTHNSFARLGAGSDGTRGVMAGGFPATNIIEYITIASEGNAIDFGDLIEERDSGGCVSSSTRALFAGDVDRVPSTAGSNVIDYIQIKTLGNALDFGDLAPDNGSESDACSSPTRGFFAGGGFPTATKTIKVVTMSSTGNSVRFGNLSTFRTYAGALSSTTRGIFAGGGNLSGGPAYLYMNNSIEYITMSTEGSGTSFGDLTQGRHSPAGSCTQTRGVFGGGYLLSPLNSIALNTMDHITISTFGNALDFGDLSIATRFASGTSDSHGGLGGF